MDDGFLEEDRSCYVPSCHEFAMAPTMTTAGGPFAICFFPNTTIPLRNIPLQIKVTPSAAESRFVISSGAAKTSEVEIAGKLLRVN